jgi:hypothetical protein
VGATHVEVDLSTKDPKTSEGYKFGSRDRIEHGYNCWKSLNEHS